MSVSKTAAGLIVASVALAGCANTVEPSSVRQQSALTLSGRDGIDSATGQERDGGPAANETEDGESD